MNHLACPVLLLLAGLLASGFAGEAPLSSKPPGKRAYSLHDAILMALESNLELQVERRSPVIRGERIRGAMAIFDPTLSTRAIYEDLERVQNTIDFFATDQSPLFEEQNVRFQSGITGLIPLGTTYELVLNANRYENTLNERTVSRFRPEFDSDIALLVTQPLLRDFGVDVTMTEMRIARSNLRISHQDLRLKILDVVSRVIVAYVDMVYSQENIMVRRDAIELAENLRKENERRVELGVMKPIDVTQAEAAASEAEETLIRAETHFMERQNELKALIFDDFSAVMDLEIETVDRLSTSVPDVSDRAGLLATALNYNPDYRRQKEASAQEEVRYRYAKNQVLPRVDLRASAGWNGLDGDLGGSFNDFANREGPEWTAGVVVSFPWRNRAAKAQLAESRLRLQQAGLTVKFVENEIAAALDTAVKQVKAEQRRVATTQKSVELAAESLLGEERRLESGVTTSFNVLQIQRDLSNARTRRLAAIADLRKAITGMWRIVGRIPELDNHVHFKYDEAGK